MHRVKTTLFVLGSLKLSLALGMLSGRLAHAQCCVASVGLT